MDERITYKDAGVDIELADRVIASLGDRIKATFRPEVIGKMGGFAALFRPEWKRYQDPVLVSAADGVGTKLKIAFLTGLHDTVGIDLVAMNVNDLLVTGAEPLFFLDYFATGALDADIVQRVISGIADGCEQAGCALIGGETAEMPDFYAAGEYDLAGFCVGIVDRESIIDGSTVAPGDTVIGLASSGLHSNGFSLVRKVLLDKKAYDLDAHVPELAKPLGEELLTPTRIYVKPVIEVCARTQVKSMAHITGGGFIGNIPRVVPETCSVAIVKGSWQVPPIFQLLERESKLNDSEMFLTFNMGIGLVMVVGADQAEAAINHFRQLGIGAWIIGEVIAKEQPDSPTVLLR
jgi:phosphoribosylformylglycinamidine cyclo-ligase